MKDIILATIVVLLITFWALAFYIYDAGSTIHLVLLIAVLAIVLRMMKIEEKV